MSGGAGEPLTAGFTRGALEAGPAGPGAGPAAGLPCRGPGVAVPGFRLRGPRAGPLPAPGPLPAWLCNRPQPLPLSPPCPGGSPTRRSPGRAAARAAARRRRARGCAASAGLGPGVGEAGGADPDPG